jgi:hypothetical protein
VIFWLLGAYFPLFLNASLIHFKMLENYKQKKSRVHFHMLRAHKKIMCTPFTLVLGMHPNTLLAVWLSFLQATHLFIMYFRKRLGNKKLDQKFG